MLLASVPVLTFLSSPPTVTNGTWVEGFVIKKDLASSLRVARSAVTVSLKVWRHSRVKKEESIFPAGEFYHIEENLKEQDVKL